MVAALAVGAQTIGGCGDDAARDDAEDGANDAPDCGIAVELSGGAVAHYEMDRAWACASPFGGDTGLTMIFLPGDEVVGQVVFDLQEIHEGDTGTFAASAEVISPDAAERWVTTGFDCTVEITEHEKVGEDEASSAYELVGTGSCSQAANPVDAPSAEPVQVGAFSFRFPGEWSK